MSFIADKQTLDDLNILGKYKSNSIYSLFNTVKTTGGEKLLDEMFLRPLSDADAINQRSKIFRYFEKKSFVFPFANGQFAVMENYLSSESSGNLLTAGINIFRKKILNYIGLDEEYNQVKAGLYATIQTLSVLHDFIFRTQEQDPENPYQEKVQLLKGIFGDKRLNRLMKERGTSEIPLLKMARYDHLLKHVLREEMKALLQVIYHLDVCITVAGVSRSEGFSYGHALPESHNTIRITEFHHPRLEKAVANSVSIHQYSNVIFLTGANMAGKSTFMKSFGVSLYLAHMGFPVAASEMEFSVKDGIYSSINVPDDLNRGYSHFYAEVLRVKKVAEEVARSKNLIVIFDELFKGTNVKDAYDATLAVTEAFSENLNCSFIISTHIIEVGEMLRKKCENLQFVYFPTIMKGTTPVYTYQLQQGITTDRHGMMIIENERVLDIIREEDKIGSNGRTIGL